MPALACFAWIAGRSCEQQTARQRRVIRGWEEGVRKFFLGCADRVLWQAMFCNIWRHTWRHRGPAQVTLKPDEFLSNGWQHRPTRLTARSRTRSQRSEVRGQKSEVKSQRSEVRGQRSEVRWLTSYHNDPTTLARPSSRNISSWTFVRRD